MQTMIIGSDKSGFALKEALAKWLREAGSTVEDVGTKDLEHVQPYYEVAPKVASRVQSGEYTKGILVCGTGMGMSITANKFAGVYAALVESVYAARMCSVINQANVLALGGWITTPEHAIEIVQEWLNTGFGEGFPADRVDFLQKAFDEVQALEKRNFR